MLTDEDLSFYLAEWRKDIPKILAGEMVIYDHLIPKYTTPSDSEQRGRHAANVRWDRYRSRKAVQS